MYIQRNGERIAIGGKASLAFAVGAHLGYAVRMQISQPTPKKYSEASTADKAADIVAWLNEHKAADVTLINLSGRCAFAEALLVATASSVRHAQSLADGVNALCGERNYEFLRMEGYQAGQWILVDMNDIVLNIFQPTVRDMYKLEALWNLPDEA